MNKKILAVLLFVFGVSLTTTAQHKKTKISTKTSTKIHKTKKSGFDLSKLQVGANLHGNYSSTAGKSSTDFGVSVFAGYRVTEPILLGIKVGKNFRSDYSNFEVGLFGRYYLDKFFLGAGINHSSTTYNDSYYYDYYGYDYGVSRSFGLTYGSLEAGYVIPVSNHINVETSAQVNLPISPAGTPVWYGIKAGAIYTF